MTLIIVIIVVAAVAMIVFLNLPVGKIVKTREAFLKELETFLEGKLEPIEGKENSYRIRFLYEGENFSFEDMEQLSFNEKMFKSYLRVFTSCDLDLVFSEKKSTPMIQEARVEKNKKVGLPKNLRVFSAHSTKRDLADLLLQDDRVMQIFSGFKNVDQRGYPIMPLKIIKGEVVLEFNPQGNIKPSRSALVQNVPSIEDCLNKLLVVVGRLKIIKEKQ